MAVVIENAANATATINGAGSLSWSGSFTATAGRLLVIGISSNVGSTVFSVEDSGWNRIHAAAGTRTFSPVWYYKIADGGETSFGFTTSGSATCQGRVLEISGLASSSVLDQSAEDESNINTSTQTQSSGTATGLSVSNGWALMFYGCDVSDGFDTGRSYNNSFTEEGFYDANANAGAGFAYKQLSASSDVSCTLTTTDIGEQAYGSIAVFKQASSGATTVQCSSGSVVITGQQATIVESAAATAIECSAATVPVTGQQATVTERTHIAATAGTVLVTGTQATVIERTHIAATAGAVPVTGQQATIVSSGVDAVECSAAAVLVTGQQATVVARTLIPATAGTVPVTGQQATVIERTNIAATPATVVVAGQQAGITETAIVTTRVECSPSTVAVIGGTGNVVSIGGLRSRRNRGRYITYTEPTAGEPLPKLPHAPRRKARLADVLEFIPTPEPDRVEPTPIKVEAKPAVVKHPVPTEAEAAAKLLDGLAAAVRTDPAIAREVIEALMPILSPRVEVEDDEEELVLLLLSRFAA